MRDLLFPGDDGLKWTNRVQTLALEQNVSMDVPYRDEAGYLDAIREEASRALTQKIMEDASVHSQTEDNMRVKHRWMVSVVMPDNGHNWFAEDRERIERESRQKTLDEVSEWLRDYAMSLRQLRYEDTIHAPMVARLAEKVKNL